MYRARNAVAVKLLCKFTECDSSNDNHIHNICNYSHCITNKTFVFYTEKNYMQSYTVYADS
jgi:hypothetical protein